MFLSTPTADNYSSKFIVFSSLSEVFSTKLEILIFPIILIDEGLLLYLLCLYGSKNQVFHLDI